MKFPFSICRYFLLASVLVLLLLLFFNKVTTRAFILANGSVQSPSADAARVNIIKMIKYYSRKINVRGQIANGEATIFFTLLLAAYLLPSTIRKSCRSL